MTLSTYVADLEAGRPRKRTDCVCYVAFIIMLVAAGVSYSHLKQKSNLSEFLIPVDFFGNVCGKDDAADYPYLLLPKSSLGGQGHGTLNPVKSSVCVSSCGHQGKNSAKRRSCHPNPNNSKDWCEEHLNSEEASNYKTYLNKFCVYETYENEKNSKKQDPSETSAHSSNFSHEHVHFDT